MREYLPQIHQQKKGELGAVRRGGGVSGEKKAEGKKERKITVLQQEEKVRGGVTERVTRKVNPRIS